MNQRGGWSDFMMIERVQVVWYNLDKKINFMNERLERI